MIGNVNTILVAGAICVTPWNTSSGRPSELRRSLGSVVSAVNQGISFYSKHVRGLRMDDSKAEEIRERVEVVVPVKQRMALSQTESSNEIFVRIAQGPGV
jgi:hypothetical protein